jgi:hypothetical protein
LELIFIFVLSAVRAAWPTFHHARTLKQTRRSRHIGSPNALVCTIDQWRFGSLHRDFLRMTNQSSFAAKKANTPNWCDMA